MKQYLKKFTENEDGIETLEWIAIVVIGAVIIGVIVTIASDLTGTMNSSWTSTQNSLDKAILNIDNAF